MFKYSLLTLALIALPTFATSSKNNPTIYNSPYTSSSANAGANAGAYAGANSNQHQGQGQGQGQGQSLNNSTGQGQGQSTNISDNSNSTFTVPRQAPPAIAPNIAAPGNNGISGGISTPFGGISLGTSTVDGSVRQLNRATADSLLANSMMEVQQCFSEECIAFKKYLLKRFSPNRR